MATVLLVEDDPGARQGLELALRSLGYCLHSAASGEAALHGIREWMADVVVLDVMLPGIDGFEVCRRLRRGSDVPVIMLTARGDDLDIVGGLEAGADDYGLKTGETGWSIDTGDNLYSNAKKAGPAGFTHAPNDAVRFSRFEDAERVLH